MLVTPDMDPSVDSSYHYRTGKGSVMLYSNNKQGKYFRFDNQRGGVDNTAEPGYPRDTGLWWYDCREKSAPVRLH